MNRRVTLIEVAKAAGVSRSLASLALRGAPGVLPEKRQKILQVAADLNYVPNFAARALASSDPGLIGVLVRDITSPFLAALARAIDRTGRHKGLDVVLSIAADSEEAAEKVVAGMIARQVRGLVLIDTPRSEDAITRIALQIPVIYVGRHLASARISSVSNDDDLGARLVARHLVGLGHRRVAHIGGGSGAGAQRRRRGFAAELAEHSIEPTIYPGEYSIDAGAAAAEDILRAPERPTAIFAANDLVALGALNHILSRGLSVPGDIAVVGYDDMPLAGTETINLTTVRQPVDALAEKSVAALMDRIAAPDDPAVRILISPELMTRRSTLGAA